MLQIEADERPIGFPGTEAETTYLQDRIQHGWDLVSILVAGITYPARAKPAYRYYWTRYDAEPGAWVNRAMMGS